MKTACGFSVTKLVGTGKVGSEMAKGFADLHNHQFANLGFGGKAFWGAAYGDIAHELSWCTPVHGLGGSGDLLGNAIRKDYGGGVIGLLGHRVGGHPQFDGWPRWDSVSHQSVFEDWLFRAVEGGLRLMVMLAVNNEFMCGRINKLPGRTCNDMEAVDLQLQAAHDMEAYIDEKNGGAGEGWYRIVKTPAEAHTAIEAGKLAVVLGIEVDYLFNCHAEGDLTEDQLRQELDKYHALDVRHLFPIHFSNNGFGGTAYQNSLIRDSGGGLVSDRNPLGTVGAYTVDTEDGQEWGYQYRAGRRNAQGLTALGRTLVAEMIARGMIVDVDHMSARSKGDTFDICEAAGYPVVSGHTGFVENSNGDKRHEGQLLAGEIERIRKLGGIIGPIVHQGDLNQVNTWRGAAQTVVEHTCGNTSNTLVQAYLYAVSKMQGGAVGLGTDFNGFAGLPGPRFGADASPGGHTGPPPGTPLAYPFTAAATGQQLDKSVIGDKPFDFNDDGLAHVGMLPDLIADFESQGLTADELAPLLNSAQGYVALWSKAIEHVAPIPPQPTPIPPPDHEEGTISAGGNRLDWRKDFNRVPADEVAFVLRTPRRMWRKQLMLLEGGGPGEWTIETNEDLMEAEKSLHLDQLPRGKLVFRKAGFLGRMVDVREEGDLDRRYPGGTRVTFTWVQD